MSELTLGFWINLFAHRHHALWWSPPRPLLTAVFANHPAIARDTRSKLFARLEYLLRLRNRVMHHEAVFQGVAALNRPVLAVDVLHDQLIETIGWISADAEKTVACMDRFNQVHDHGKVAIEAAIKGKFGIP